MYGQEYLAVIQAIHVHQNTCLYTKQSGMQDRYRCHPNKILLHHVYKQAF